MPPQLESNAVHRLWGSYITYVNNVRATVTLLNLSSPYRETCEPGTYLVPLDPVRSESEPVRPITGRAGVVTAREQVAVWPEAQRARLLKIDVHEERPIPEADQDQRLRSIWGTAPRIPFRNVGRLTPFGSETVFVSNEICTVKMLIFEGILSLQRHSSRSEVWYALDPGLRVYVGGKGLRTLDPGEAQKIDLNAWHWAYALRKRVRIIEVGFGWFSEDDISRIDPESAPSIVSPG